MHDRLFRMVDKYAAAETYNPVEEAMEDSSPAMPNCKTPGCVKSKPCATCKMKLLNGPAEEEAEKTSSAKCCNKPGCCKEKPCAKCKLGMMKKESSAARYLFNKLAYEAGNVGTGLSTIQPNLGKVGARFR